MNVFRLLVTRHLSAAAKSAAAAKAIRVTEEPFIEVAQLDKEDNPSIIRSLAQERLTVIFTSQHAVKAVAGMAEIAENPANLSWKIFCIAGTTEKLVRSYFGEKAVMGSAHYAEELAALIVAGKPAERIVFFCGNRRRDTLPDILKRNGLGLQELVVYTTTLTPHAIRAEFDGVAFFSPSAAESFFSVNRPGKKTVCFSIGDTTTAALKALTDNRVITSRTTTETAMIEAVAWYKAAQQNNQTG